MINKSCPIKLTKISLIVFQYHIIELTRTKKKLCLNHKVAFFNLIDKHILLIHLYLHSVM